MSHNKGYHKRGNQFKGGYRRNKTEDPETSNETNPVIKAFQDISIELDNKHDRYERIVKISRDITIESKRIIFLLHTHDIKKDNNQAVLEEAKSRLQKLCSTHFMNIAKELHGIDPYQYSRAYSAGLQEFIEAYTFYNFIANEDITHWKTLQETFSYKSEDGSESWQTLIQPTEYILGLGDLTGEIMRNCINSLSTGDVETCFSSCRFMQEIYQCFLGIASFRSRDLSHKIYTLRQSLLKTENICYNVKVRGGEAAKWGSDENQGGNRNYSLEDDEGVFF